jgi:hypothetical protein
VAADAPPARQPIPATDASGGSTAEAAPSPGRAQFAGPGVPPDAVAPPPSPGAAGNADAIAQGMIARGADPDTLAPTGRGVSADEVTTAAAGPAVPPAPDVPKPPAYPDITVGNLMIRHPGEFNDYYKQQYVPPPKTEDFNPDLTPAQKAAFAERQAGLNRERQKIGLTLPDKNQPEALRGLDKEQTALNTDVQNMIQAKRAAADAKLTTYDDAQQKAIQTRYDLATQAYNKAFDQAQQGDIVSRQSRETSDLASRKTIIDQLGKEAVESRGAVSELDGLLALSNNVKNPSVFATLKIGDTTILNRMAQLGIVDKGEAGATQLLQSGISNAIARLRQGMSMGNLSDRDLNFIENMAPNVYENPQTRAAVISYLRRAQDQKMRYNLEVNKLTADGKPISEALKTAAETIETKYPIVPLRSQELADHWLDPDPVWKAKRQDWAEEHNIRPGTMFRKPNGGLEIVYSPGMAPVKAPVAIEVGGNR